MKKIANAFIVLFVFALLCSNNLFAQAGSYETVTGINNPADANGRYDWVANDGPDGRPRYQHTSGNYHIYAVNGSGGISWYIDVDFDPSPSLFFVQDDAMLPPSSDYNQEEGQGDPQLDYSLPVELSSFSAQVIDQSVHLQWATESEVDNLGFIVERREKGQEQWQQIASFQTNEALKGQGNTSGSTRYTFTDIRVQDGITYQYRLGDVDIDGKIEYHESIEVTAGKVTTLPDKFALQPAFPNPFNPGTTIQYNLFEDSKVSLKVTDVTGRIVRTLVSQQQAAGSYSLYWNGKDDKGTPLSSGSYFIKLKVGENVQTQKVVVQR